MSIYWERRGGAWDGEWLPAHLSLDEILFSDGVYNIKTEEHTPIGSRTIFGPMLLSPYATEGGDAPNCNEFEQLVELIIPDKSIREYFQESMGTILQPHAQSRAHYVLWGKPHTGKTTVATALACAPAGMLGASFETEYALCHSQWAPCALVNMFANVSNDSATTPKWEPWMKSYTSGVLTVEQKYRKRDTVLTTAKLISTCNELQPYTDASGASAMRLIPFRFDVVIPATDYPNQANKMRADYWSQPARRAGVVEWLLQGLIRLRTRGKLLTPTAYKRDKESALSEANPIEQWLRENLEQSDEGWIATEEIIRRIDLGDTSVRSFQMQLSKYMGRLFGARKSKVTTDVGRVNGYVGVKWGE